MKLSKQRADFAENQHWDVLNEVARGVESDAMHDEQFCAAEMN
jgi:hypothetical protein